MSVSLCFQLAGGFGISTSQGLMGGPVGWPAMLRHANKSVRLAEPQARLQVWGSLAACVQRLGFPSFPLLLQAEDDGASFATAAPAGRGKTPGVSEYGESFAVRIATSPF